MKNKLYYQFAGSCLLLVFAFCGYTVKFHESWFAPFDTFLQNLIRGDLPTKATHFFLWITKFANPLTIILVTAVTLYFCYLKRDKVTALYMLFNIALGAGLSVQLFKFFFTRARPDIEHLVVETSFSFPSGHASGSLFCYGTILICLSVFIANKKIRRPLQVLLGIGILTIGISRIYLGVHHPTDIIGGFALAGAWLCGTYPIYQKYYLQQTFQKIN